MSEFWDRVRASVVGVRAGGSFGTGWVALPNGLVVTNVHVVGYDARVALQSEGGVELPARVVHADTKRDIAFVMPIGTLGVPALPLGPSAEARPGQPVVAIGHPLGLAFTVTQGILSAVGRDVRGVPYLQTDAALNPGNSGGPLIDREARVIGVNTWIRSGGQNLGFAVPVHLFQHELQRFAGPVGQVTAMTPVYRCIECDAPYQTTDDRCLKCGAPVPFASGAAGAILWSLSFAQAERSVANMIARLGYVPNQVWVDKGTWRLPQPSGEVWVHLDQSGDYVSFAARLVKVPPTGHEALFRFLLTVNDRTSGPCRLSLEGEVITLSFAEPTIFLNQEEVLAEMSMLLGMSEELRGVLSRAYGAPPPRPIEEV